MVVAASPDHGPEHTGLRAADHDPKVWPPRAGDLVAVVPPDWEITDARAPRAKAEVVEVAGNLVTLRAFGHLRLRRLHEVAPWVSTEIKEEAR